MNFTSRTRNTCTMTEVLITFCLTNHFTNQSPLPSVLPNSCKQTPSV